MPKGYRLVIEFEDGQEEVLPFATLAEVNAFTVYVSRLVLEEVRAAEYAAGYVTGRAQDGPQPPQGRAAQPPVVSEPIEAVCKRHNVPWEQDSQGRRYHSIPGTTGWHRETKSERSK